MDFNIIATGSTGNAVILNKSILIDCGVPYKQLQPYAHDLQLVLLTHIHGDHFKPSTVKRLAKERPGLRWCCGSWMIAPLLGAGIQPTQIDASIPVTDNSKPEIYNYPNLATVQYAELFHDVPNCGWKIQIGNEKAFYATDTANLDGIEAKNYDLYLIEANYTEAELAERIYNKEKSGEYSYEWRVKNTHMSKETATNWLAENMGANSKYVFLHQHATK